MGKKKASKSKKLRPLLEQAIRDGRIYCREFKQTQEFINTGREQKRDYDIYQIVFGEDEDWFSSDDASSVHVVLELFRDGEIKFRFISGRKHMLDRTSSEWFKRELEEIIVMHKLGAFMSEARARTFPGGFTGKRKKTFK
jgi:hypothetical protein